MKIKCVYVTNKDLFKKGMQSQAHAPTHALKCLDM